MFFQKIVNILNISERIRIFIKDNLTNIPKYEEFNDKPNYFYPLILAVRTNNSDFIKGFILELKDINFSDEDAKYFIDNIEQDIDELTFLTFFRFILAHCSDAHEIMSILTGVLFTGKLNRTLLSNFYIFQKDKSQSEKIKFMKKCSEKFWIFSYKSKKPYRVLYFLESDLFYENDSADYRNLFYYCMDLIYDDERHNMGKILSLLTDEKYEKYEKYENYKKLAEKTDDMMILYLLNKLWPIGEKLPEISQLFNMKLEFTAEILCCPNLLPNSKKIIPGIVLKENNKEVMGILEKIGKN